MFLWRKRNEVSTFRRWIEFFFIFAFFVIFAFVIITAFFVTFFLMSLFIITFMFVFSFLHLLMIDFESHFWKNESKRFNSFFYDVVFFFRWFDKCYHDRLRRRFEFDFDYTLVNEFFVTFDSEFIFEEDFEELNDVLDWKRDANDNLRRRWCFTNVIKFQAIFSFAIRFLFVILFFRELVFRFFFASSPLRFLRERQEFRIVVEL
jgi:hypothetical protein